MSDFEQGLNDFAEWSLTPAGRLEWVRAMIATLRQHEARLAAEVEGAEAVEYGAGRPAAPEESGVWLSDAPPF